MKCHMQDFAATTRQLFLQGENPDRPFDPPEGYVVARQSDFESSAIWRAVILVAVIVIVASLFSPAPTVAVPVAHSARA